MNTKSPLHGRFSLLFAFALLAAGSVACGAAPDGRSDGTDDPSATASSSDTPPPTDSPRGPATADAGDDAAPAASSNDPVEPGDEPSGGAAGGPASGRRGEPQRTQ